ncbi:glycoside hydrolase family 31 protein [Coniophora puteana RWD-64-598 SS2]|uniref:Glycoside hydrolase family 31 protein n=1 Tax=Coniophora puteana (strain RWD-64-598) TaxID=741705 RepID=A0A5M3M9C6_CONPW|nr:glycoside hydrolase family 31 protein [Coniophora puteana RWD-64-598 SS2]EIW75838.1 glycoside hydrolase family 31 protein [Coniophora puteana RWD-64-598 SS2]
MEMTNLRVGSYKALSTSEEDVSSLPSPASVVQAHNQQYGKKKGRRVVYLAISVMLPLGIVSVLLAASQTVWGSRTSLARVFSTDADGPSGNGAFAKNVTGCPGYTLQNLIQNDYGLQASLSLAGDACNAFGHDIANLTIEVVYETESRLHVHIFDAANQQFTIPDSVIERPAAPTTSHTNTSDLEFNYDASPFAFWITRRSQPDATPLFDTRTGSLPPTPAHPYSVDARRRIASALPKGANIYGLGEVISSSGFRRDIDVDGTMHAFWGRDMMDPIDQNMYGSHPIYMEHRYDESTQTSSTNGVLLLSSSPMDVILTTPPSSNVSLIEYRVVGGTLDFYFFAGPTASTVMEQYGGMIGYPTWQPAWAFGFHLCRWGWHNVSENREVVNAMREANIPLETQWNDIDLYHDFRDFTSDPVSFPGDEMRDFIVELASNHQHYIPIVDAGVAVTANDTDVYDPYTSGVEQDVWIKNPDGSIYMGQVWPGYSGFADWLAPNTQQWWTQALQNWSDGGVTFDGIWLDMNEPSSFCNYSCGTGANFSALAPYPLRQVMDGWPECYNDTLSGRSGNMTVNGTNTDSCLNGSAAPQRMSILEPRGVGAGDEPGVNVNYPPYGIHNAFGPLYNKTLATNATHHGGYLELDLHNMFGLMEEKATHIAVQAILKGKRPFLISRSTFPSSGKWSGHWLGDNFSTWKYMYYSIQGILQFQLFQIPMVGADSCGFLGNTDEELCNRWMMMSAFVPFYRNHNTYAALSQEPYRWDSVANASRIAIAARYSMLPYWYTLFANSSTTGTPPVRALWYEFPNEPELFAVDKQWLIGSDILVTPVLEPGATTVDGVFPGRGHVTWRDWWTHAAVNATSGGNTTLPAPISTINVHVRDNSALLLHQEPAYTTYETRQGPYELLVSLSVAGGAFGTAYVDDGESYPPGDSRTLKFVASPGQLQIQSEGAYNIEQKLETVTILGVAQKPGAVSVQGQNVGNVTYLPETEELVLGNLGLDLNQETTRDVIARRLDADRRLLHRPNVSSRWIYLTCMRAEGESATPDGGSALICWRPGADPSCLRAARGLRLLNAEGQMQQQSVLTAG